MSDVGRRLFTRLPGPLRALGAGLHGHRLRRWRYGPETPGLVSAAHERERWTVDHWQTWLLDRRRAVLDLARSAPHYRDLDTDPENWGLLDKATLRADPARFLVEGADRRRMYEEHTSGSTGTPLRLWWSRQTVREWYALFEARGRGWHGVSRHEPWAILGGRLVVATDRTRPPFWVWNSGLHQLYLSSYHLTDTSGPAYADALEARGVTHLVAYPSAAVDLSRRLLDAGRTVRGVRTVIANAEPLSDGQRATVTAAFAGATVVETYGMAELAAAASECEAGGRHLWPEVGSIDIIDGELVATGLLNRDMPLVDYRTGDRLGSPPDWSHGCPCGRTLPTIGPVDGRTDDVVVTPDGRRLGRLDPIFKADLPVVEAQIVQDRPDHLTVRVVPASGFDDRAEEDLVRRVRDHVGAMDVDIERTGRIPRGAAGKLRGVVSALDEPPG